MNYNNRRPDKASEAPIHIQTEYERMTDRDRSLVLSLLYRGYSIQAITYAARQQKRKLNSEV